MKPDATISPLHPWASIFPESTRRSIPADVDLYAPGDTTDEVFLVETGAIVEIRADGYGVTHAVGLSGVGSLLGARLTATNASTHPVRATALIDSVVRAMERGDFLHSTLRDPDLASAYMIQIAHRLEVARVLSETCSARSASDHILGVLRAIASTFGVTTDGRSMVAVRADLLERMTGTPHRILEASMRELSAHGLVNIEKDAVRWVM
jgi:CRP-like cAMP-binding protein